MPTAKNTIFRYIYTPLILIAVLVFILVLGTSLSVKNLPDSRLGTTALQSFSDNWSTASTSSRKETIVNLSSWKVYSDVPLKLSKTLPELTDYDSLFLDVNFIYIKIFVDDICIYDYSEDTIAFPGQMTGHFICQVPLSSDMSGRTLSLQVYQPNKLLQTGIASALIGPGSAYITNYLYSHLELIVSLFLILVTSFALFSVYLWLKYKSKAANYRMFRSLSLFLLLSALWIFTDSTLPQLFWKNSLVVCLLSFFCFMTFPVPLFSFVSILCPDKNRILTGIRYLLLINMIVQGILYSAGAFSLIQMLPVTHFLIALSVIVLLIFLLKRYGKNESPYAKPLLLALVLLILSGALALVIFYFSPQTDNSRYLRYGFFIFIGIMVYICVKVMLAFVHDYTEHRILKDLAYHDILTGAESRMAFEELMDELRKSSGPAPAAIYVFDLNNLKIINDTYGHKAGDMILKASADCISEVFGKLGRLFRIGGDEFVVVIPTPIHVPHELVDALQEEIHRKNANSEYPFTVSAGYAVSSSVCGSSIDILFKKADREMYKNKAKIKGAASGRV